MLQSIKKPITYDQLKSKSTLARLAREAKKFAIDENQYRPPPLLGKAVFSELVYEEDSKKNAPQAAGVTAIRVSYPKSEIR